MLCRLVDTYQTGEEKQKKKGGSMLQEQQQHSQKRLIVELNWGNGGAPFQAT
ncbi:unnamed protein product [Ixodes pacificus]